MSAAAAGSASEDPIAIICGAGTLPFAVAESVMRRRRPIVLFALRGLTDPERVRPYPHYWAALGQFGWFCRIARTEGCREVVFIGSVARPRLWRMRPDATTLRLLPRVWRHYRGGDDYLLSGIGKIFEEHGFRLVGIPEIAPEILMPAGPLGRHRPSEQDERDIEKGLLLLSAMSPFDVGQAAVVADQRVLAIEAAEGTDRMLSRIARLRQDRKIEPGFGRGVLVKAAKRGQDRRLDLPSIGPQTIELAAKAGLAGIAVSTGSVILAEVQRLPQAADQARLFVVGMPEMAAEK